MYRRRNNVNCKNYYKNRDGEKDYEVDNSMALPYNGYFFNKYEGHINFEYCGSIAGIKYIYNYLHKGLERAHCKIRKINDKGTVQEFTDEISTFIHGRCKRDGSSLEITRIPNWLQESFRY